MFRDSIILTLLYMECVKFIWLLSVPVAKTLNFSVVLKHIG